jgi:hypothetical protein
MRATLAACAVCGALLAIPACRTLDTRREVPAVVVHPSAPSRAALRQALSAALDGAPVALAADALTGSSTLVIERAHPRDVRGLPLSGRDLGAPERFQLVASDGDCVLVHDRTGRRFTLSATECAPR